MESYREKAMTASGINVLAGLWLIIAPFVLGFSGTPFSTNSIIIGIIVTILAIIRVSTPLTTGWLSWVNGLLGLWTFISPFVLTAAVTTAVWNSVLLGLLIVAMAIWSASSAAQGHPRMG